MPNRLGSYAKEIFLMVAATLGGGMFALPFIFKTTGIFIGASYLVILGSVIAFVHLSYWKVLETKKEKQRLLGMVREELGTFAFVVALLSVLCGLFFALLAYLLLGSKFLSGIFPGLSAETPIILFWALASVPLFMQLRRFVSIEFFGEICIAGIIVFIFLSRGTVPLPAPQITASSLFTFFGPFLFAIAGWTAVEPMFEFQKELPEKRNPAPILFAGTLLAATFYILFSTGILSSASVITADTLSGLGGWPFPKFALLGVLGLCALWAPYGLISREVKNALINDLHLSSSASLGIVSLLPLIFVLAGFKNFLVVVGLAGGVFISLQYLFIVLLSRKVLGPRGGRAYIFAALTGLFIFMAVYELYKFVLS